MDPKAHMMLMIHGHLPYVRHPHRDAPAEEEAFFDALTDCYLPLLRKLEGWLRDGVPGKVTLAISPTLAAMMGDAYLGRRYVDHTRHVLNALGRPEKDAGGFSSSVALQKNRLELALVQFEDAYRADLLGAFSDFQNQGLLEITAGAATRAFLPFFQHEKGFVRAQIRTGLKSYRDCFGRRPLGIWLPDSGYYYGLEELLADEGLSYLCVDGAAVSSAKVLEDSGVHQSMTTPPGITVFALDQRAAAGLFLGADEAYVREEAPEVIAEAAARFVCEKASQLKSLASSGAKPAVIAVPVGDTSRGLGGPGTAELLDFVVRKSASEQASYCLSSPSELLDVGSGEFPIANLTANLFPGGDTCAWSSEEHDWVWRHLHAAIRRMNRAVLEVSSEADADGEILLAQMGRELFLASAGDWPTMLAGENAAAYGSGRLTTHLGRFRRLAAMLEDRKTLDPTWVSAVRQVDSLFAKIDPRDFVWVDGIDAVAEPRRA